MPEKPTIHLVRHLPPEPSPTTWVDRRGLAAWLDSEGARGIVADPLPSQELVALVIESRHLLISPLARAQATATAVLDQVPVDSARRTSTVPELREAPLPVLQVPRLRLPLGGWGQLCRVSWFLGYAGSVESRSEAVDRARSVARRLGQLAPSGPVTVIGHGIMNILVARELRRRGWKGPRLPSQHHGGISTFRSHDPTMHRRTPDQSPSTANVPNPPSAKRADGV